MDINAARLLVHELRRLHDSGDVKSLAWVVMPDHLHWLFQLNGSDNYCGRINSALQAQSIRSDLVGLNLFDQANGMGSTPNGRMNSALRLSRVVKTLKGRSALAINRYLRRSGSLWQRAYYDRAARKDEDIRRIARYIIANPLRAGFERNISDYPYWDCI